MGAEHADSFSVCLVFRILAHGDGLGVDGGGKEKNGERDSGEEVAVREPEGTEERSECMGEVLEEGGG